MLTNAEGPTPAVHDACSVFIAGCAEEYGDWRRADALAFVHGLASTLVRGGHRVVSGFGWGIGSAVVNGVAEAIRAEPDRWSDAQLVVRPQPVEHTGSDEAAALRGEYQRRTVAMGDVAIFLFGNTLIEDGIIDAPGMITEFATARHLGRVCLPVGATGYVAGMLAEHLLGDALTSPFEREAMLRLRSVGNDARGLIGVLADLVREAARP